MHGHKMCIFGCSPLKTLFPFSENHSCILMAGIQNILHHIWKVSTCYIMPHPVQLQRHCQHFLFMFSVFTQWRGLPLVLVDLGLLALMHPKNKCGQNVKYISKILTPLFLITTSATLWMAAAAHRFNNSWLSLLALLSSEASLGRRNRWMDMGY